jgi:hypothetical protein
MSRRVRSHAAAGAATRDDASACRTSNMRKVGSRDELRCHRVRRLHRIMGDFRGVSDRAYPAALNTSHAAMRHLMRHGGLGGGRRLRFAGHPGTAPCGMDPNVSKPARCRQWRSARAYRRITVERHVRTTAPPVHPGRTADVPATNVQSSGSPSSVYTNTTELHAHSWIGSRRRAQALTARQQRRDRYAL